MQTTVMLSWIILVVCTFLVVGLFVFSSRYQRERQNGILLSTVNELMTQNYQTLHEIQLSHAKQLHDFNHHLSALRSLLNNNTEATAYVDSLLNTTYRENQMCRCGSDVIDAIINQKAGEALDFQIHFTYEIAPLGTLTIDAVDLCAILANQIENAFDACKQIEDPQLRKVAVHIWQQTPSFLFIKVTNTTVTNPLIDNKALLSTKTDQSRPHGLGLISIRDTVRKYHGELKNSFQDGQFCSLVFLCSELFDTNISAI